MDRNKIRKKKPLEKEEKVMPATLKKGNLDHQSALVKISSKIPVLDAKKGKVKLDPNNPNHKDWYEDK